MDSVAFDTAFYAHLNNEPKCQALLQRAVRYANHRGNRVIWVVAKDQSDELKGLNAQQRQAKPQRWLQAHDKDTNGIPGLLPLAQGLPLRLAQPVDKKLQLFKKHKMHLVFLDPA